MLWAAWYFPQFPLQIAAPMLDAFCIIEPDQTIAFCNEQALAHGIKPGMSLASAYSLSPTLRARPRDTALEQQALQQLAAWALQFTAKVHLADPQTLLLEIGGSERYFGDRQQILDSITEGLQGLGYRAHYAVTPTPRASQWLSRNQHATVITDRIALKQTLDPLALHTLPLPPALLKRLLQTGLRTLNDCFMLPRTGFAQRFSQTLQRQLDQALGKQADPRAGFSPPLQFQATSDMDADVTQSEALLFPAHRLLWQLQGFLRAHGKGVQQWRLLLQHVRGEPTEICMQTVELSQDSRQWLQLIQTRMHNLHVTQPVRALSVHAECLYNLTPVNASLFLSTQDPTSWQPWFNCLTARLGREAVSGLQAMEDHRPEKSWSTQRPDDKQTIHADRNGNASNRPLWLLDPAQPLGNHQQRLCWQQRHLQITQGPERITGGWWDGQDVERDYFIATDKSGVLYWIFFEKSYWYIHGLFG